MVTGGETDYFRQKSNCGILVKLWDEAICVSKKTTLTFWDLLHRLANTKDAVTYWTSNTVHWSSIKLDLTSNEETT